MFMKLLLVVLHLMQDKVKAKFYKGNTLILVFIKLIRLDSCFCVNLLVNSVLYV